jgi:hypothetical protein
LNISHRLLETSLVGRAKAWRPWTRATAAVVVALASSAPRAVAQACFSHPVAADEAWLGGSVEGGSAEGLRRGFVGGADVEHVIALELAGLWGGYPSVGRAEDLRAQLGVPITSGPVELCPYGSVGNLDYEFRDQFEVSHGNIAELSLRVGAALARTPSATAHGPQLGGLIALEYVYRSWDMDARKLRLQDNQYVIDVIHRIERTYHLAGRAVAMIRWGRLGLSAGVGTRPRTGSDFVAFVNLGFLAARLPRGGQGRTRP